MSERILDTSVLIRQWNRKGGQSTRRWTESDAAQWANELVKMHATEAILTPVKLEFVCGARSKEELQLADAFLKRFKVADKGRILVQDWREAERLARRVPWSGKRRQLGDCLVRAISNRLRVDVISYDDDFPG